MKSTAYIMMIALIFWGANAIAQCDGGHSTSATDMWLSCAGDTNPNADRSEENWILYDLGAIYTLEDTHVWNYNVTGSTDNGMQDIIIDVSNDGSTWSEWGVHTVNEAPGLEEYGGEIGPDFDGEATRFVLISISTNWGGDCYGFAELKLNLGEMATQISEPTQTSLVFGVYPNPAKDALTVQLHDMVNPQISLFSINGRLIERMRPTSPTVTLDVSDLAVGMYLIQVVESDGSSGVKRVSVIN